MPENKIEEKASFRERMVTRIHGGEINVPWHLDQFKLKGFDFAQKYGVRIPVLYQYVKNPREFKFDELPETFVIKPTVGYSCNGVMLLVRKENRDRYYNLLDNKLYTRSEIISALKEVKDEHLRLLTYNQRRKCHFIAEEFLISEDDRLKIPPDYKCFTFLGKVALIVERDRTARPSTVRWYDRDWTHLAVNQVINFPGLAEGNNNPPKCKKDIVRDAEKLSANMQTPFVRVDFYATNKGCVFGEFTLTPGSPTSGSRFFTPKVDTLLGNLWNDAESQIKKQNKKKNPLLQNLVIGKYYANEIKYMTQSYLSSLYGGYINKDRFRDINTFCMFIGAESSGSTLVGALLDSHPNMVIANELDTLKYLHWTMSKNQVFFLILKGNIKFVERWGYRKCGGRYIYDIPNQWQGKSKEIRVIGDKKAGIATIRLRENPGLLEKLRRTVRMEVKLIYVIRNPYDTISTETIRWGENLEWGIKRYFQNVETVAKLKKQTPKLDIFDLRHEALIDDPKLWLKRLCEFLGQEAPKDYLDDCASIVYKKPHKSRFEVKWTPELIELVKGKMAGFEFLNGYSYEG